jgi:hypothetical protein
MITFPAGYKKNRKYGDKTRKLSSQMSQDVPVYEVL